MSDDLDLLPPAAAPEVGHPVRSFVAVLVLAAVVLLALQWSGALWPQLSPGLSRYEADLPVGRVGELVEIRNDGALPVRVRAVDWPSHGLEEAAVERIDHSSPGVIDLARRQPATDFEIPAGGSVTLVLSGLPTCDATVEHPRLHVDSWFGPDRTVDASSEGFGQRPLSDGTTC